MFLQVYHQKIFQVLNNKNIEIFSNGKPTRTFCYITDAIIGYLLALTNCKFDYFNIGNDSPEISVLDFANIFIKQAESLFNFSPKVIFRKSKDNDYLVDNPNRRCPNITKAKKLLGYNPKIEPYEGVRRYLIFLKETI